VHDLEPGDIEPGDLEGRGCERNEDETLLQWWQSAIAILEGAPNRHEKAKVHCAGVVIVHLDGTYTCSRAECPMGKLEEPLAVAERHKVFVSCGYLPRLPCPRCEAEADQGDLPGPRLRLRGTLQHS